MDKTGYLRDLVESGSRYFLSRPRRFGKSLLVSTLKSLFACERDLFDGLAIEPHWNWSRPRAVVHLDLSGENFDEPDGLQECLVGQIDSHAQHFILTLTSTSAPTRFAQLLEQLHLATGRRVVVLVDEYDKPILDVLDDPKTAWTNRNYLRGLYSVIKRCDEHVRFCFLTGVSKFSRVSLFSGLNNLEDITLEPHFSSLCGYTESDLETVFAAELEGLDRDRLREWYNGSSWGGDERVYNPFDVLLLLKQRQFRN